MADISEPSKKSKDDLKKSREIVLETIEKYIPVKEAPAVLSVAKTPEKKPAVPAIQSVDSPEPEKKEEKSEPVGEIKDKPAAIPADPKPAVHKLEVKKISDEDRKKWLSDMDGLFGKKPHRVPDPAKAQAGIPIQDKSAEMAKPIEKTGIIPKAEKSVFKGNVFPNVPPKPVKIETRKIGLSERVNWLKDMSAIAKKKTAMPVPDFLEDELALAKSSKQPLPKAVEKIAKPVIDPIKVPRPNAFSSFMHRFFQESKNEIPKTVPVPPKEIEANKLKAKLEDREKHMKDRERAKQEEEKKAIADFALLKKRQKEKRRRIREFKRHFANLGFYLRKNIKLSKSISLLSYLVVFSFIICLFLYSIFAFILLELHLDNRVLRMISAFVPVPAIIYDGNVIPYYAYADMQKEYQHGSGQQSFNAYLAKTIIGESMLRKYGMKGSLDDPKTIEEFEKKIIFDVAINDVGISRIKKIREMAEKNSDFVSVSNKFGDSFGQIVIKNDAQNLFADFQNELKALEPKKISRIEYAADGYYLFYCLDKSADNSEFAYVFVKAKSYNEYLNEAMKRFTYWNLTN